MEHFYNWNESGIWSGQILTLNNEGETVKGFETRKREIVESVDNNDIYKYLGIELLQSTIFQLTKIEKHLKSALTSRLQNITKSYLNNEDLKKSINT